MKIIVNNVEFPFNEGCKLLKLKHGLSSGCPFKEIEEFWNDIEPLTFKEIITVFKNVEQRRIGLLYLGLENLSKEIKSTLVSSETISKETILEKIAALTQSLKNDFLINKPRIAVLGLNPHAGDNGKIGNEELEIITPLVQELKDKGQLVYGPFPADGFFASGQFKQFDAVLAMYHDQGLIPLKLLGFHDGVNVTLGLPFVRTSPDHGTAYEIAGTGAARPDSFLSALRLAAELIRKKRVNDI
jgi:4-hydroxy-L-threonine phosphate dehydrogenase PdxA